jgi:hypothetical protein
MKIETVYHYYQSDGTLAYEVVRFVPKDFRPRMPDGSWGLKTDRILYRLPQLDTSGFVWLCEGEKDADTLAASSLVPPTTGAAGTWAATNTTPLHGAWGVVIVPDCDPAGEAFAITAANTLFTHTKVQIVDLGGSDGYDATDYVEDHGVQSLLTLRSATPTWHPPKRKRKSMRVRGHRRGHKKKGTPGLPYGIDDLSWELGGSKQHGNNRLVYCPAHDDEGGTPGLSLTAIDDDTTLAYCHSGCDFLEIARAVKERME